MIQFDPDPDPDAALIGPALRSLRPKRHRQIRSNLDPLNDGAVPHVTLHGIEHKSCGQCGSLRPTGEFSRDASKPDGLQAWCKDCHAKRD